MFALVYRAKMPLAPLADPWSKKVELKEDLEVSVFWDLASTDTTSTVFMGLVVGYQSSLGAPDWTVHF